MGAARQTESGDGPDLSSRGIRWSFFMWRMRWRILRVTKSLCPPF
jgi:hypothetical protein